MRSTGSTEQQGNDPEESNRGNLELNQQSLTVTHYNWLCFQLIVHRN